MKSKSKGFFHFGRHAKDESEVLQHAGKKGNIETSAAAKLRKVGRQEGNDSRQMNNHDEDQCWLWEQSRDNPEEIIQELREADQNFWNHEFDEAIALYLSAIPIARERLSNLDADIAVGDINVKISIILQGRGELQSTIDHLLKAKDIFTNVYNDIKSEHEYDRIVIMAEKIIEVTNGIANTFVEMGEKEEAVKYHEDAIELCKRYFPRDTLRLSNALNNYANFLSICQNDHESALDRFKEALKISFQANHGILNAQSAPTLTNMGKLYMRRSEPFQGVEVQKDAKKAEVCFARAVQLYRMSMVPNRNEKVAETLYNLMQAREWQSGKGKGILKNVRFDPQTIERQYTAADFLMAVEEDSGTEDDDYDEDDYTYDSTVATDQVMCDFDIFGLFFTPKTRNTTSTVDEKETDHLKNAKQNKPQSLDDSTSIIKEMQEQNSTQIDKERDGDSKGKQSQPSVGTCHDGDDQQETILQKEQKVQQPSSRDDGDGPQQTNQVDTDGTNPLVSVDYFLKL